MSKILIGIIVAMGLSGILYYQFSVVPMKNKLEEQAQALSGLQVQNQQYEAEMSEYLDIFRRHNLAKLASAKPGMIEKRAKDRTKEVFDAIEADSKRISSLND